MKTRKSMFNLIEITMAIAVVGIGIAGIMALFPPAIEANRVANVNNYVGGFIETMASFMEYYSKVDWHKYIVTDLKEKVNTPEPPVETSSDSWSNENTLNFPNLYEITKDSGRFAVRNHDKSIEAHIRIWKEQVPDYYSDPATGTLISLGYEIAARIFIELSWPIAAPYANREKKVFVYEFYRE